MHPHLFVAGACELCKVMRGAEGARWKKPGVALAKRLQA